MDPLHVEEEFRLSLQDLTSNSKPIINCLTMVSEENIHAATNIVKVLKERILTASPNEKLPSIYLLDSIVKNVGGVYIELISPSLEQITRDSYFKVDEGVKGKLIKLAATWDSIFPPSILASIKSALKLKKKESSSSSSAAHPYARPSPPKKAVNSSPNLKASSSGTDLLLGRIREMLQFGYTPAVGQLVSSIPDPEQKQQAINLVFQILGPPPPNHPFLLALGLIQPPPFGFAPPSQPQNNFGMMMPGFGPPPPSQMPTMNNNNAGAALPANIITPALASMLSMMNVQSISDIPPITLDSEGLSKSYDPSAYLIYGAHRLQCKSCAIRFPDTEEGKEKLTKHMDWHFYRNRRLKEKGSKIICRELYITETDWIANREGEDTNGNISGAAAFFDLSTFPGDSKEGGALGHEALLPDNDRQSSSPSSSLSKELLKKYSRAATTNPSICSICRDKLEPVWNEELEDWVFEGVVGNPLNPDQEDVGTTLNHISCYRILNPDWKP